MVDLAELKTANAERWAKARLIRNSFTSIALHLVAADAKLRYQSVENTTGVPWWFIAVIHERESGQSWRKSLAQGDPWNEVSTHVPAGRGPFRSWEEAAIDALMNCAPHAAANADWSIGGALTAMEKYNGLGYASGPVTRRNGVIIARYPPQASPYLWAGTDQYSSGKYTGDGDFNPSVVDSQPGAAGLLTAMVKLDPSIRFGARAAAGLGFGGGALPQASLWARLAALLSSIFKRS